MINEAVINRFRRLISRHSGLYVRDEDVKGAVKIMVGRMKSLAMPEASRYLDLLEGTSERGHLEWETLAPFLTVPETFFFRDKGQIALLKNWILPNLIKLHQQDRCLRLWSAGCSTGAEPYSLAILLHEMLPERHDWDIVIMGTDINPEVLRTARKGLYAPWSLRGITAGLRDRYFRESRGNWKIDKRIRAMVTFRAGNLVKDKFPDMASDIHDMDFIMCRNVFIYFDKKAISAVVRKFMQGLSDGGYLMTGHAELMDISLSGLSKRLFPESLIYQRGSEFSARENETIPAMPRRLTPRGARGGLGVESKRSASPATPPPPNSRVPPPHSPLPTPRSASATPPSSPLPDAEMLMASHDYRAAAQMAARIGKSDPRYPEAVYLMARAYANLGEYAKAAKACRQAIDIHPFEHRVHYLLAQVCEALGDRGEAMLRLKKVLYLEPAFIPAYLELAALYDLERLDDRAGKMRLTVLDMLKKIPPESLIEPYEGMTAGQLIQHLEVFES